MLRNPYYSGPRSDHFDGLRFHSPTEPPAHSLLEIAWMTAVRTRRRWPSVIAAPGRDRPPPRVEGLRLCLIGHASLLIQIAGLNLLVDPLYAERVGPVSFAGTRRAQPPGILWEDLPPIDAILITHNHYDHLDGPALARLWQRFGCRVIAPLGNDTIIRRYDPRIAVETYDWGGCAALSDRLSVHLTPAYHWSGRGIADRRMALWCSFVLAGREGGVLYHVGDTGYGDGAIFPRIREHFGPPDVVPRRRRSPPCRCWRPSRGHTGWSRVRRS